MISTSSVQTDARPAVLPLWARLLLAVLAGGLLACGYGLHPLWWAPWLVPVILLPAAGDTRGKAWMAGAIAGAVAMVGVFGYYMAFGAPVAVLILVLRIFSWGGAAAMASTAWRRLPAALAMLALPVFITALETLTLTVSVHGAAGSLAYSQMDVLPVIQMAAFGGVPAVCFLVLLPGSLIGGWLAWRPRSAQGAIAAACATAILGVAGAYAGIRLSSPEPQERLAVAMIASDRFPGITPDWDKVWAAYGPVVARTAPKGGLVVLPEKIALLDDAAAEHAAAQVSAAAHATGATVITGIEVRSGTVYHNRGLVASPDGVLAWYTKQRLVPGFEARDTPGTAPLFFRSGHAAAGLAICKDMHIPSIGHEYAGRAGVLAVPAWDFGQDGWMGARMTMMRGIEGGYAIVRSARDGKAGAYDAYGRVIAEAPSSTDMTVVTAAVPSGIIPTFYTRFGDVFGHACQLAALGFIAAGLLRRRAA